jgi:hypothetical protein
MPNNSHHKSAICRAPGPSGSSTDERPSQPLTISKLDEVSKNETRKNKFGLVTGFTIPHKAKKMGRRVFAGDPKNSLNVDG